MPPQLFEVFGFPLSDRGSTAEKFRQNAMCPFMGCECDGGGNRYLSHVDLSSKPELKDYFGGRARVPSGVCSIQPKQGERPWIVCPRRLMVLAHEGMGKRQ